MTGTPAKESASTRLFDTIEDAERTSLQAVRKLVDSVSDAFPDLGGEDGPRHKIIDSAFNVTEQLVAASTQFARKITTTK